MQNTVGAGEYGIFYTLFNFSLLLNILLDFGITNFNNREISRHPQLLSKYLSNLVGIKILLAIVYAFFTISLALILGYSNRQITLLFFLILNQFLASLILYLRSNLSGLQLFKLDSLLSVLDKAVMILICSVLLWTHIFSFRFSIEFFVLAQTGSYLVSAIVVFAIVAKKSGPVSLKMDRPFIVSTLRSSAPYALLVMLMTIYGRVDSVVIERILPNGNVSAGIYAQAFRLLDAANMFPFLFASLLLPIFSKMIKHNASLSSFVGFSTVLLLVPVISFAIPTFTFRDHIMGLLYHEHELCSSEILGVLMGSFVFIAVGYILGTLLTAQGDLKHLNIISAVTVAVSISIQLFLVSRFNIIGAAFGNLATNGLATVLQLWLAFRRFRFRVDTLYIIRFAGFVGFAIFISILADFVGINPTVAYLTACMLSFASAFIFRLISYRELKSFFAKDTALKHN